MYNLDQATQLCLVQGRFSVTLMTKNGVRVPCMCHKCHGASKDYRTARDHMAREEADRPLFPESFSSPPEAKSADNDEQKEDSEPELPIPGMDPEDNLPYLYSVFDDMVSHAEALPGCHEPIYESVYTIQLHVPSYTRTIYVLEALSYVIVHQIRTMYVTIFNSCTIIRNSARICVLCANFVHYAVSWSTNIALCLLCLSERPCFACSYSWAHHLHRVRLDDYQQINHRIHQGRLGFHAFPFPSGQ
jgi:hypothetical protein